MMMLLPILQMVGEGIPLHYSPRMDDTIAIVLLCCFFLSAYVLSRSRKFLFQLVKDFFLNRERPSIFTTSTGSDMRYLLFLIFQTFVLGGVYIFNYFSEVNPGVIEQVPTYLLLGIYIGISLLYFFFKWLVYTFLGWIFFDGSKATHWLESYFMLLYYTGFVLFSLILFIIYFELSISASLLIGIVLLVLIKILMFYKWIKLFCDKIYGILLLILYFCALEIIPCMVLYRGLIQLNDYLVIKF